MSVPIVLSSPQEKSGRTGASNVKIPLLHLNGLLSVALLSRRKHPYEWYLLNLCQIQSPLGLRLCLHLGAYRLPHRHGGNIPMSKTCVNCAFFHTKRTSPAITCTRCQTTFWIDNSAWTPEDCLYVFEETKL